LRNWSLNIFPVVLNRTIVQSALRVCLLWTYLLSLQSCCACHLFVSGHFSHVLLFSFVVQFVSLLRYVFAVWRTIISAYWVKGDRRIIVYRTSRAVSYSRRAFSVMYQQRYCGSLSPAKQPNPDLESKWVPAPPGALRRDGVLTATHDTRNSSAYSTAVEVDSN
jgi:hypothetical protein